MNIPSIDHVVKPLSPRLLALLRQHRDLCRLRLALTQEIEAIERQIDTMEQDTRRVVSSGVGLVAQN